MLTLLLMRHAQAAGGGAATNDHDRPLDEAGAAAAEAIGRRLVEQDLRPGLTLCSSALRASQTWSRLVEALGGEAAVQWDDGLYLAPGAEILTRVCAVEDAPDCLLVIAHNPGLHELALHLAGGGGVGALASGFPAGAVAVFACEATSWAALDEGAAARLTRFLVPGAPE